MSDPYDALMTRTIRQQRLEAPGFDTLVAPPVAAVPTRKKTGAFSFGFAKPIPAPVAEEVDVAEEVAPLLDSPAEEAPAEAVQDDASSVEDDPAAADLRPLADEPVESEPAPFAFTLPAPTDPPTVEVAVSSPAPAPVVNAPVFVAEPVSIADATPADLPFSVTERTAEPIAATKVRGPLSDLIGEYAPTDWIEGAFRDLVAAGVSDVHLNMNGNTKVLSVEARLDGDLELVRAIEGREATVALNMLKTRADLSTSSSLVPGDGRYELDIDGYPYRVRAVSLPLFDGGEKIVLRLPQTGTLRPLDQIGATQSNLTAIREMLSRPGGMTLIAGPMGEGKTTTAHAAIMEIGTEGRAVIAVEDPVERVLGGVSQIEVNEEVGAGFGHIMRFLVRADFDTLFLGEIRDAATAAAAVRMAKAGRRVISTIHATDNVTAMLRLIELSEDSPLSALDAVAGVISQRLVRKVDPAGGYTGRHPIHEVMTVQDKLTDRLIESKSLGSIRDAAAESSTTFDQNLSELIAAGVTDQAEARRVVGHDVV